jgi:Tol biopolymer transport system component
LAYCAERNGNFDIYTIPVDGGEEKRLTISDGLDDGPDYSSDGKYIYFNSYRTGHMQIWRMQSDGTNQEQLTLMIIQIGLHIHHLITNGSFISYMSDEKQNHLFGKHVQLKLMNIATKQIQVITPVFYGGQGTFNVPSWSSDEEVAFVFYQII